ncbi:copper resistance CopC family protein [Paenibacillus sp. strain BS8-2]
MKRIILICLALIWLLPQAALAHSKLEESVPEKDSVSETSPQEIRLTFNTRIEKISDFKLFDSAGNEIALGKTGVEGATMSNRPAAPLDNGVYKVKWTIVGADSHAIEGEYSFSVEAHAASPTPEPTAAPAASPSAVPDNTEQPTGTPSASPTADAEASPSPVPDSEQTDSDNNESGMSPLFAIGGVILVVAVAAVWIRRRKP